MVSREVTNDCATWDQRLLRVSLVQALRTFESSLSLTQLRLNESWAALHKAAAAAASATGHTTANGSAATTSLHPHNNNSNSQPGKDDSGVSGHVPGPLSDTTAQLLSTVSGLLVGSMKVYVMLWTSVHVLGQCLITSGAVCMSQKSAPVIEKFSFHVMDR